MQIIEMETSALVPYVHNPRNNDYAVDAVAASIKEFGFKVPIIVDSNNEVVAGHTRLKAAEKLKLDKVPVIVAHDLSDEKIKAFRLADNKVGELAEWDDELLAIELEELENLELDMSEFGFEDLDSSIDGIFFDDEEQMDKDSATYLKWGNSKAWISQNGLDQLDSLYDKYKNAVTNDEEIEFVQWLLNKERINDEADAS